MLYFLNCKISNWKLGTKLILLNLVYNQVSAITPSKYHNVIKKSVLEIEAQLGSVWITPVQFVVEKLYQVFFPLS